MRHGGALCTASPKPVPERLFWCCESEEQTTDLVERFIVIPWGHTKWYWVFGAFSTAAGHQREDPENGNRGSEGVVGKGSSWGAEME